MWAKREALRQRPGTEGMADARSRHEDGLHQDGHLQGEVQEMRRKNGEGAVGEIADRVWDRLDTRPIKAGCIFRRIGIDETSYKKGHKYITVVVDHDRRCVIWVHEGYGKEVLDLFMRELSEEQRKGVELVTCDGAKWIRPSIEEFLPNAERCVDSFHVVQWATEALDKVRVEAWKEPARKTAIRNGAEAGPRRIASRRTAPRRG